MQFLNSCSHPGEAVEGGRTSLDQANFPRLSELPKSNLLARASEYRRMAETATTADVRIALLGAAEGWEGMAAQSCR